MQLTRTDSVSTRQWFFTACQLQSIDYRKWKDEGIVEQICYESDVNTEIAAWRNFLGTKIIFEFVWWSSEPVSSAGDQIISSVHREQSVEIIWPLDLNVLFGSKWIFYY